MSEVFLRQVKQLAMHRLRGNESQPEYPHQNEQAENNNKNENVRNPNFLWARPQITSLWTSLEQSIIADQKQKMLNNNHNLNHASPNGNNRMAMMSMIISPNRDPLSTNNNNNNVLPYLMYRQMICRELARELGFVPEGLDSDIDDENMTIADRATILSMYRQHLTCGPATYFDAWRNQNKEAILKYCISTSRECGKKSDSKTCQEIFNSIRDPILVDVMSQIGAVNFFADLRSLLEGIRSDRLMKENNNNNNTTKKSTTTSVAENPIYKNLHQRLCRN